MARYGFLRCLRTGFDGQASTWRHCELITGRRGIYPGVKICAALSLRCLTGSRSEMTAERRHPAWPSVAETKGSAAVAALQQFRLPGRSSGNSSDGLYPSTRDDT